MGKKSVHEVVSEGLFCPECEREGMCQLLPVKILNGDGEEWKGWWWEKLKDVTRDCNLIRV